MRNRKLRKALIDIYCKLFILGHRAGCHQRPDRSFFIKSYQFPICARCTGVLIGYLIAPIVFLLWGSRCFKSAFVCLIMLLDWLIQFFGIKESTNIRRLMTGILGGYGIEMFQIIAVIFLAKAVHAAIELI